MNKEVINKVMAHINSKEWIDSNDIIFLYEVITDKYSRGYLLKWNSWNDRNGCYLDKDILEEFDGDKSALWTYEGIKARTLDAFEVKEEYIKMLGLPPTYWE